MLWLDMVGYCPQRLVIIQPLRSLNKIRWAPTHISFVWRMLTGTRSRLLLSISSSSSKFSSTNFGLVFECYIPAFCLFIWPATTGSLTARYLCTIFLGDLIMMHMYLCDHLYLTIQFWIFLCHISFYLRYILILVFEYLIVTKSSFDD